MKTLFTFILVFCSAYVNADELNDVLKDTQSLLRDSSRVQTEAAKTPEGKKADQDASIVTLGKPELKQELLGISADLMGWIAESSNGDPVKMQQLLQDALANPKSFLDRMPTAERAKVKSLSEKIEGARAKNPYP